MEPTTGKPSFLRNIMVKALLFSVLIIIVRFAYVITITGESCNIGDFCFFSLPENFNLMIAGAGTGASSAISVRSTASSSSSSSSSVGPTRKDLYTSKDWIKAVQFYSSVFQDLISEGYLSPDSKSLCVESGTGQDVFALKEIGVQDAVGISKKASKPLVISGQGHRIPFDGNTFDFIFSGGARFDSSSRPLDFASEITRTLKPEGFFVVHVRAKDTYSFNSFLDLFNSCKSVRSRDIDGFEFREIVMQKKIENFIFQKPNGNSVNNCSVPGHKRELVRKAEPLIEEEPLKPWITLKKNIKKIKYLTSMVDISFKNRYVYVDVGARGYGSSIVGWFKKQYPKQNKTFDIYAIEADKTFHEQYKLKKRVTLLPYAAWVKNETLFFEINRDPGQEVMDKGRGMGRIKPGINRDPGQEVMDKGRGMGRIKPGQSSGGSGVDGEVEKIQGFDFAEWLKNTVTEKDFVVMKMDVEGTEFDLIPRLFETGAICLIDEIFLECHYNRWQRLVPGRSTKYEKTYGQCLELLASLRKAGVLVHQWW